jgi:hypothetical protein
MPAASLPRSPLSHAPDPTPVPTQTPKALLVRRAGEGGEPLVDAIPAPQQTPEQREAVRQLQPQAVAGWWSNGHVGWTIFPVDTDQFTAVGGRAGGGLLVGMQRGARLAAGEACGLVLFVCWRLLPCLV